MNIRLLPLVLGIALAAPAAAAAQNAEPAVPQQEEAKPPQQPPAPPEAQEAAGTPFLDFDRLEATPRLGLVFFSDDFEADPEFAAGVQLRAPLPWLSRDVFGLESDDFGLFVDFTVSSIERDIDILEDPDGTLFFASLGFDFTFARDDTWLGQAQLGIQFGDFGGVTDLDDGVALLVGAVGGVQFSEGLWATVTPQVGFGDSGDRVYFLQFGVQILF